MELENRSFILSQVAAAKDVFVRFPAGHYIYPLRYLLPASLPPSSDPVIRVKDESYSTAQVSFHSHVKLYG